MLYHNCLCTVCNPEVRFCHTGYREDIVHHFKHEQPDEAKALCGFSEAILEYSFEDATVEPGESEPKPVLTADQVMYRKWAARVSEPKWPCQDEIFEGRGSDSLAVTWSYLFALKLTQGRPFSGRNLSLFEFMCGAILFDWRAFTCRCSGKKVSTFSIQTMITDVHGVGWLERVYKSYRAKVQVEYLAKSLPEGLAWFRKYPELF